MTGEATEAQIGAFITALRMKGETVVEITAAARVPKGPEELNEKALVTGGEAVKNTYKNTCKRIGGLQYGVGRTIL